MKNKYKNHPWILIGILALLVSVLFGLFLVSAKASALNQTDYDNCLNNVAIFQQAKAEYHIQTDAAHKFFDKIIADAQASCFLTTEITTEKLPPVAGVEVVHKPEQILEKEKAEIQPIIIIIKDKEQKREKLFLIPLSMIAMLLIFLLYAKYENRKYE